MRVLALAGPQGTYPTPLEDDGKTLGYYGLADGCEVLLEEVDAAEAARQAAAAEAARAARMAEQEAVGNVIRQAAEMSQAASRDAAATVARGSSGGAGAGAGAGGSEL